MTQCFYQPGTLSIIDLAVERDGALRGRYSNESLDEMRQRYPGAIVGDLDAFIEDKERQLRTEPEAITAAQFEAALCVLPPLDYRGSAVSESFKCSEMFSGRITAVYCHLRVDGREHYFTFSDVRTIKHEAIVARCLPLVLSQQKIA